MAGTKRARGRRPARASQLPKAVDEGRESLDFYLQEISRIPLLTVEEETALARRAFKGDIEAQERLARHNVRFVVSVAKKFQNRGVPLMDLIGEGNVGLMTAARKFDPDRGVKFISYAVWWIRQAIQAAIARHGRPVRVPLNRTADLNRLGRATVLLTERLGRAPTTDELMSATGLTRDAVRSLSALHIEAMRLDHPVREADDRGQLERFVPLAQEGTDANTLANSRTHDLETALAALPPRDAKVLRLYFGLDDGKSRTLEEIGRMMGVTRERIRQLRDRALRQLREQGVTKDPTVPSARRTLRQFNFGERDAQGVLPAWGFGRELCYDIQAGNIVVEPASLCAGNYAYYYLAGPVAFDTTGAGDATNIATVFEPYVDFIVHWMGIKGLGKEESPSEDLRADLMAITEEILAEFNESSDPSTIIDIEQTGGGIWP